jgi:hypothetical protein
MAAVGLDEAESELLTALPGLGLLVPMLASEPAGEEHAVDNNMNEQRITDTAIFFIKTNSLRLQYAAE